MDPTSNSVSNSTGPTVVKNNRNNSGSPTATMDFPTTKTLQDGGDKKPSAEFLAAGRLPASTTRANAATTNSKARGPRHFSMDDDSSDEEAEDHGVVKLGIMTPNNKNKKSPPSSAAHAANDEKARARRERMAVTASYANKTTNTMTKLSPAISMSGDDAKSRERQARLAALKQQQQAARPRRQVGNADDSSTSPAPPLRRGGSTAAVPVPVPLRSGVSKSEDPDVLAKRRARAQMNAGVRAVPPARTTTPKENPDVLAKRQARASRESLGVRKAPPPPPSMMTSTSSHSSSASTPVAQNLHPSKSLEDAAMKARTKAVGLVLEDADDEEKLEAAKSKASAGIPRRRHSDMDALGKAAATSTTSTATRQRRATISTPWAAANRNAIAEEAEAGVPVGAFSAIGGRRTSKTNSGGAVGNTNEGSEHDDVVVGYLNSLPVRVREEEDSDDEEQAIPRIQGDTTLVSTATILEEDEGEDKDFQDEAVAEVGVEVVRPGAFSVAGIGNATGAETEDNESEGEDPPIQDPASGSFDDPTVPDPSSDIFGMDPEAALEGGQHYGQTDALEAHIHEEALEVVGTCIVENDDEKWSKKSRYRWGCGAGVLVMALTAGIMVAIRTVKEKSLAATEVGVIPTIEGWSQMGANLTGPTDSDKSLFGYDVAIDSQAQRIAIGVPGRDQGTTELSVGEVHIMDWNGTQWLPQAPIYGPGPEGQAGSAVAMSGNGKRVAVGSPFFAGGGHVAVYEEVAPAQWDMVGQILVGDADKEDVDERFGSSLALSEDGTILAIGATMGDGTRGVDMGYVKVFQLQNYSLEGLQAQWMQLGQTLYGENAGDFFGWSLDMSSNGKRLVGGSVGSFGGGSGEFTGEVRAFDFDPDSSSWIQAGAAIAGQAAFDSFGCSVSISGDGSTLAVGAIGHSNADSGVDVGHVRIFEFTDTPAGLSWEPLGQTLVGQNAFDSFGYSVSLSENGKVVAAGGPRNDEFSESSGHIQVFEWDETTISWTRRGSNIGGSYEGRDLFGWSLELSADGSVLVGGAPFSMFDGRLNNVGTVRIYEVDE